MASQNENLKSRPALVIGVGGTGQWVLAYLKKDLLESYGGVLPSNIRLLGLDTMPMSEGKLGGTEIGSSQLSEKEEHEIVHAGAVRLEGGKEFIYLGGDAYPISQFIKDGGHPHIGSWYDAEIWLKNLPKAAFILDDGAGRIRQFGRIAAAMEFLGGRVNSILYQALNAALSSIAGKTRNQHVEIIIVGSFAGGTGSGMFIDVAWLARRIAELNSISASLRGYFVLPGAFAQHDQEMMARTFAAWRELNRFMSQGAEIGSPKMVLAPKQNEFEINTERRLFDACYLVDSWLGNTPLSSKPQNGIFPSIADAISTILDSEAGGTYVQKVERNLAPEFDEFPGQPMYSTMSTYTFKVPIYYYQQEFSFGLSKGVLGCLVAPRSDGRGGLVLSPDKNLENPGKPGSVESLSILHSGRQEYNEMVAYGNLFTKELSDIAQNHQDGQTFQDHLERAKQSANRGGRASGTWVNLLCDFGDAMTAGSNKERLERLKHAMDSELKFNLANALPTSNVAKDELRKQPGKIESRAEELLLEHYGTSEVPGSFNKLLKEVSEYQLENFRHLVRVWLLRTLNGINRADPEKALGGKLGYAKSTIVNLRAHLEDVQVFMSNVEQQRAKETPELELKKRVDKAKTRAEETTKRTHFWGLLPDMSAKPSIENYRIGLNRIGLLTREIVAFTEVRNTVRNMIEHVLEVQRNLDVWEQTLMGDSNTGLEGLYLQTNQKLDEVRRTHAEDKNLGAIQQTFEQEDVLDEDGNLLNQEVIQNTLSMLSWEYKPDGSLQLSINQPGQEPIILKSVKTGASEEARKLVNQENLATLQAMGRARYSVTSTQRSVATRLERAMPNYEAVVDVLYPKYWNTLFQRSQYIDPHSSAKANSWYIRVNQEGAEPEYFPKIIAELAQKTAQDPDRLGSFPIEVVGSANQHKMTAIRTADCWFPDAFVAWHDCLQAFKDEIHAGHDVSKLHVYPAERNAVRYEQEAMKKFPRERGVYRPFHPRVVMLLDNEERLKHFFMAWILGFITQKEDGNNFYWELQLPGGMPLQMTRSQSKEPEDQLFRLMNNFVLVGKDMKAGAGLSINDKALAESISNKRKEIGLEETNNMMEFHTKQPAGAQIDKDAVLSLKIPLIPWLEAQANVSTERRGATDELIAEKPEYWDLATVARIIFSDEMDANKKRIAAQ